MFIEIDQSILLSPFEHSPEIVQKVVACIIDGEGGRPDDENGGRKVLRALPRRSESSENIPEAVAFLSFSFAGKKPIKD